MAAETSLEAGAEGPKVRSGGCYRTRRVAIAVACFLAVSGCERQSLAPDWEHLEDRASGKVPAWVLPRWTQVRIMFGLCSAGTRQAGTKGVQVWCQKGTEGGDWINHGPFKAWWPNGNTREAGIYREGQRVGLWTSWHENGQAKATGIYREGARAGRWQEWWPNGQIAAEGEASGEGDEFSEFEVVRWDEEGRKIHDGPKLGREAYLATYRDPSVVHVRKALDEFLRGGMDGIDPFAVDEDTLDGNASGLRAFDSTYYTSKFVVYSLEPGIGGGMLVSLIFRDRPDAMFVAWVYPLSGSELSLRAFWRSKTLDATRWRSHPFLQADQPAL